MTPRVVPALLALCWLGEARAAEGTAGGAPRLEERLEKLEAENEELRAALTSPRPAPSHLTIGELKLRFTGYLDVGVFKAFGDGVSYVFDNGKKLRPQFADVPWVFVGDPWANAINAQGESADLGLDRTNIPRFDPIRSGGRPSFIINTANLGLVGSLGQDFLFETRSEERRVGKECRL